MGRGSPGRGVEELCLGETLKGIHAPWQDPGGLGGWVQGGSGHGLRGE